MRLKDHIDFMIGALVLGLAFLPIQAAIAQQIQGLPLGGNKTDLWEFGIPWKTEWNGDYITVRYHLPTGVDFAVTYEAKAGHLVSFQSTWNGSASGPLAEFGSYRFGSTTLAEILLQFGSNGVLYEKAAPAIATASGEVELSNTYDIATTAYVTKFVTSISRETLDKLTKQYGGKAYDNASHAALLHSITVATRDYFEKAAGQARVPDIGYKAITWAPKIETEPSKPPAMGLARIKPSQFPAFRIYDGPRNLPDFTDRDAAFSKFRTRITDGMARGPTFAGEYSVIQFGCGTGCSIVFVGDNRTGEVFNTPIGGENNLYLTLKYQLDSKLLISQWADIDTNKCYIQFFSFDDGEWTELLKREVGSLNACNREIAENVR